MLGWLHGVRVVWSLSLSSLLFESSCPLLPPNFTACHSFPLSPLHCPRTARPERWQFDMNWCERYLTGLPKEQITEELTGSQGIPDIVLLFSGIHFTCWIVSTVRYGSLLGWDTPCGSHCIRWAQYSKVRQPITFSAPNTTNTSKRAKLHTQESRQNDAVSPNAPG